MLGLHDWKLEGIKLVERHSVIPLPHFLKETTHADHAWNEALPLSSPFKNVAFK